MYGGDTYGLQQSQAVSTVGSLDYASILCDNKWAWRCMRAAHAAARGQLMQLHS